MATQVYMADSIEIDTPEKAGSGGRQAQSCAGKLALHLRTSGLRHQNRCPR